MPREAIPSSRRRLAALDAFRGLTVLLMWLVNNAALDTATPRHLTHAEWSGALHLADLVFPWFLFAVGISIPLARRSTVRPVLRRGALLFALGCLLTCATRHRWLFKLDVLQLIALAYVGGAALGRLAPSARAASAAALLLGHAALLRWYPVPGAAAGLFTAQANAIDAINQQYLDRWHLSGLLSAVPTTALVLLGTLAGERLRHASWRAAALALAAAGALALGLGYLWAPALPFNKPLWTGSYLLAAGGIGALALAALHTIAEGTGRGGWLYVLIVPGSNALVGYVAPILVKVLVFQSMRWPGSRVTVEATIQGGLYARLGRIEGGWAYTLGYMALWWLALALLHRRRLFLRV